MMWMIMINTMVMMMIKTTMMWMMMMINTMVMMMTMARGMVAKSMLIADNLLKRLEKWENSLNVWKGK